MTWELALGVTATMGGLGALAFFVTYLPYRFERTPVGRNIMAMAVCTVVIATATVLHSTVLETIAWAGVFLVFADRVRVMLCENRGITKLDQRSTLGVRGDTNGTERDPS